jgi:hypothetical protein
MSDDKLNKLNKESLAERDVRIFKMRQAGVPVGEIARRWGISTSATNLAIQRQLQKLNKEALLAYPEVLRMELERLDALQQAIWPLTQHRKVRMDDGTEVPVEPDLRAVAEVRAIMAARAKLLGMEQTNVSLSVEEVSPQRAILAGAIDSPAHVNAFSPEEEARKLLEVMAAAGILNDTEISMILGTHKPPAIEAGAEEQNDGQP